MFSCQKGVLPVDSLEKPAAVSAAVYTEAEESLLDAISIRPELLIKDVLILHNHASPHTTASILKLLQHFRWENLDRSSYSPGLGPGDFHFYSALKKHLGGHKFQSDQEVETAVTRRWLFVRDSVLYGVSIEKLLVGLDKRLSRHCDNVEKRDVHHGIQCTVLCPIKSYFPSSTSCKLTFGATLALILINFQLNNADRSPILSGFFTWLNLGINLLVFDHFCLASF